MKALSIIAAGVFAVGLAAPDDALACRTALGDFVWADSNRNGIQDPGEPGINGVRLRMTTVRWHGVGVFETVTANDPVTGNPGWYMFTGVECGYDYTVSVVAESVPAGYTVTTIHAGSDTSRDSNDPSGVTVMFPDVPGVTPPPDFSLDFGFVLPCTGAIGDRVWLDLNRDGVQDAGEPGINGALVDLDGNAPVQTSGGGGYLFSGLCAGSYTVCVQTPSGMQPSPANVGDDSLDSDGLSNGVGKSCTTVTLPDFATDLTVDFGFNEPEVRSPGTGTPGYWKNHPEAWPVDSLTIGGVIYTQAQILPNMEENPRDKTTTLFRALVAAKLNVLIGNADSCVASTIANADTWIATYGPVGAGVKARSEAWRLGEPLYRVLDNYNNGMLCAPARE